MKRRLAVISTHSSPLARAGTSKAGGMNVYIDELSRQLTTLGWDVDIYTRWDHPDLPDVIEIEPGMTVFHVKQGPPEPLSPIATADYIEDFSAGARDLAERHERRYDLVHSHYWISGLSGATLAQRWNLPHATMFHTLGAMKNHYGQTQPEPAVRIEGERRVAACADAIVCATTHEERFLIEHYGADPARLRVVPCGIDLNLFGPAGRPSAQAILRQRAPQLRVDDGPGILFVGRLEPLKGADLLVRALPSINHDLKPALWIVGGDERDQHERERLRTLAQEHGVGSQVRFLNAAPRSLLPDLYRAAAVCAMPSYYESFGLVAVEAMAVGTPVVATRVGGLASTVSDGRTGLLVDARQPESFAAALERLLEDPTLRERMGTTAAVAMNRFAWPRVAEGILCIYDELLRTGSSRRSPCAEAEDPLLAGAVGR